MLPEYTNRINKYLLLPKLANEEKFNELLAYHPSPFKGKSFAEKYPTIADEWNSIKNQNLTPFHFYPNSNMSVWWKCKKGHEWKTKINHRANGSGCPYCSGRVADFSNNLFVFTCQSLKRMELY